MTKPVCVPRVLLRVLCWAMLTGAQLLAQIGPVPGPPPVVDPNAPPAPPVLMPQTHEYQRVLRDWIATLKEDDFDHHVEGKFALPEQLSEEQRFRLLMLHRDPPCIGFKRGAPSLTMPPGQFVLSALETPAGVRVPPVWPQPLGWLQEWEFAGNPYFGKKALKYRALVTAAVNLIMTDHAQESGQEGGVQRTDYVAIHLVVLADTLGRAGDQLTPAARQAYVTGLKRLLQRHAERGPRGDETYLDWAGAGAMVLAAKNTQDPEIVTLAQTFVKRLLADPWSYHPAGYFPEQGGYDGAFNGISLFWITWMAALCDWDFVKDAFQRAWTLRGYLLLPEPTGRMVSPSHMNIRLGSDAGDEQWAFNMKYTLAAILDERFSSQLAIPDEKSLATGPTGLIGFYNTSVQQTVRVRTPDGKTRFLLPEEMRARIWRFLFFATNANYPIAVNVADDYFTSAWYQRRMALIKEQDPILKPVFLRQERFTESFGEAFVAARRPGYGVLLHTGPVSEFPVGKGYAEYNGPYGLGGGALSAFWTPATGAVVLGRRSGMWIAGPDMKTNDTPETWRHWPSHAVIGMTTGGRPFSSARIIKPALQQDLAAATATVKVSGVIPPRLTHLSEPALTGTLRYERSFELSDAGLQVRTQVSGDQADELAELYEALPIYLGDSKRQPANTPPTTVEVPTGAGLVPLTDQWVMTSRVRLTRFGQGVELRFPEPRRVRLATSKPWADTYLTRAQCHNLLIDLAPKPDAPFKLGQASVTWEMRAYPVIPALPPPPPKP